MTVLSIHKITLLAAVALLGLTFTSVTTTTEAAPVLAPSGFLNSVTSPDDLIPGSTLYPSLASMRRRRRWSHFERRADGDPVPGEDRGSTPSASNAPPPDSRDSTNSESNTQKPEDRKSDGALGGVLQSLNNHNNTKKDPKHNNTKKDPKHNNTKKDPKHNNTKKDPKANNGKKDPKANKPNKKD
ncbi:hypothetical protein BGX33_000147 [Mortierella sp. NVP41]|nr:hypothetical protein BGX33_000147 [Mortierella sp. NVP41]